MARVKALVTILDAKGATGVGTTMRVGDYQTVVVSIGTASSANLTVKCQGAIGTTAPTFSSAASVSNHWDYVQMVDLQSGSTIDGDTGISFSGSDDFRLFEINTSCLDFLTFIVTARSAGSVTVKARGVDF